MLDPYLVLGIPPSASDPEIRAAYLALAKLHHPDKGGDPETFKQISQAYSILSDANSRAAYNRGTYSEDSSTDADLGLAVQHLMGAFQALVGMHTDFTYVDLIGEVVQTLERTREDIRRQMETNREGLNKVKALKRKLSFKGKGINPIHGGLDQIIRATIGQLQNQARERKAMKTAIALAKDYDFDFTARPVAPQSGMWFSDNQIYQNPQQFFINQTR